MKRIPEPELMNDPQQVAAYTGPALDNAYWIFIQRFRKLFPKPAAKDAILDLGCGPAVIPLRLAGLFPRCEIHGVDGSSRMLEYGREAVQGAGLEDRVRLFHGILPDNFGLPRERYEFVISNSFLHHLADPMVLWNAVQRYGLPHAGVLVVDLLRPADQEAAEFMVDTYVPDAPPLLRHDMLLSLRAAYTLEEISAQLRQADLAERLTLTMASPLQFAAFGYLPEQT
jgi:ubiquinone/menaquinone biosynthesis C-methylase UbiE